MNERYRLPKRAARAPLFALLASVLVVLAGCAKDHEAASGACPELGDARPVDQVLLAWLSKAKTLHHLADLAETEGQLDHALARLDQLVAGALPPGQPPEAEEVLADTYARIADLRARRGEYDQADEAVKSGLGHAPGVTYFRGHLLEVRGLVFQKQSSDLEKAGQASEATRLRERAVAASLQAVKIQDAVIKAALGDAGGPATRD